MIAERIVRGMYCWVDYFDTFKLNNRYNEPAKVIKVRADNTIEVEIDYPIKKRVIVPSGCIHVETI